MTALKSLRLIKLYVSKSTHRREIRPRWMSYWRLYFHGQQQIVIRIHGWYSGVTFEGASQGMIQWINIDILVNDVDSVMRTVVSSDGVRSISFRIKACEYDCTFARCWKICWSAVLNFSILDHVDRSIWWNGIKAFVKAIDVSILSCNNSCYELIAW